MAKTKHKILLVEDDPAIIDVYKIAFDLIGVDLEVLMLGKDGIDKIQKIQDGKEEKPDLVLLDLLLPDINGIEILKKIRENNVSKNIRVFILSNYANSETSKTEGASPDKFILKADITPTKLTELIKKELKIK
jgi:DNA-binding response OmpR family regulator